METPVEIRYAGVVVARANEVRRMTVGGVDLFLAMPEPLPAGTVIALGNDTQARIEKVIESSDPSVAGVYVKLLGEGEASQPWVPAFREAEVPAPRPPAVVVSPVIVRPVHIPRAPAPPPEPIRAQPAMETPLPEVVAAVVVDEAPRLAPFVAPLPAPNEQVAHFDTPAEPPPPAVVERAIKRERSKRSTIVVAIPPPAEATDDDGRPPGAVEAVGEIDTGSRRVKTGQSEVQSASIMVEPDPQGELPYPPASESGPAPEIQGAVAGELKPSEVRLEDLPPARALPPARGRATKRRRTTQR